MLKKLIKLTVSILILFLLPVGALASGKMEVKIGEKVTLQRETVEPGSTYKWIIKKGREIISTQTAPIFSYTFMEQGEYDVNLTLINSSGDTKNTSVYVLVGDRYPRPSIEGEEAQLPPEKMPLTIKYSVLPLPSQDGVVHLMGDTKVLFNIEVIRDDILEYRIDRNIFQDSDGNGTANDDIDNANDDSYLLGGIWETEYKEGEAAKIVAEITLVAKNGEKAKSQIEIVFGEQIRREGDPVAKLEVIPAPNPEDQIIYLYDEISTVAFYPRRSEGNILEYRIDKNIFVDSDDDGNPANDIDNKNDPSFKTGDVWKTEYNKTDDQIIAQLITVGEGGKGSRIQRGILFTDKPKPSAITEVKDSILLTADKDFVLKGDPINFAIEGLIQTLDNYIFEWDFDDDGLIDQEIEANNKIMYIYDLPGIYNPSVKITDKNGNIADFTLEIVVKDTISTTADFEFQINGNTVEFINLSTASFKLANKNLNYMWNFGDIDPDGYESQKSQIGIADPIYTYNKAGNYIVTLNVVDADDVVDIKTSQIVIEADLISDDEQATITEEESVSKLDAKKGGSIIVKILKVILYLILIIVILIVLIFIGFLVFLKLQHPDLTFEELIDEIKIKILGMLGVHEMLEQPAREMTKENTEEKLSEEEPVEGEIVEPETKEAPLAKETGPAPDWLKESSVTSNQQSEDKLDEESEDDSDKNEPPKPNSGGKNQAPPLSDQNGPVPDWLKGA